MTDPKFAFGAALPWGNQDTQVSIWQDTSVWALETFGLPGNRYVVDININDMTWWFECEQDRLIFLLRNGTAQCLKLQ